MNNNCILCDGKLKFYDGCLGYSSLVCVNCHTDINDLRVYKDGNKMIIYNISSHSKFKVFYVDEKLSTQEVTQ